MGRLTARRAAWLSRRLRCLRLILPWHRGSSPQDESQAGDERLLCGERGSRDEEGGGERVSWEGGERSGKVLVRLSLFMCNCLLYGLGLQGLYLHVCGVSIYCNGFRIVMSCCMPWRLRLWCMFYFMKMEDVFALVSTGTRICLTEKVWGILCIYANHNHWIF